MPKKKKLEIQPVLYEDFQVVFEHVVGNPLPKLNVGTAMFSLGINSLNMLEAVQLVSNKYKIHVTVEELGGALVFGRIVFVFENKIAASYADKPEELQKVLASPVLPKE